MKKFKRKKIIISCSLIFIVVGLLALKPHIRRLLDNRERAVMVGHDVLIREKIQDHARGAGAYPSSDQVNAILEELKLVSPHTNMGYELVGNILDISDIHDSQVGYGLGEYQGVSSDTLKAYVCIGIDMPRTHEGGASCQPLSLDNATDVQIKYELSCETNWLGFSKGCDETILQREFQ